MKKMTALLLAAAMAVSMTACSPSEKFVESQEAPAADEQAESGSNDGGSINGLSADAQALLKSITVDNAEATGICGANAMWYYKDNVLFIKGEGAMADFGGSETPWPWDSEIASKINWVIVEEGITTIGSCAFYNLNALSRIELPNSISSIGGSAFESCTSLTSITLPETVTLIGAFAFHDCTSLKEFTIPASVNEIGEYGFAGCAPITITFEGDAPRPSNADDSLQFTYFSKIDYDFDYREHLEGPVTIQYHGTGFDEYIQNFTDYNWVQY